MTFQTRLLVRAEFATFKGTNKLSGVKKKINRSRMRRKLLIIPILIGTMCPLMAIKIIRSRKDLVAIGRIASEWPLLL